MKTHHPSTQKWNGIPFLMALIFLFTCYQLPAQAPAPVFAQVLLMKVAPGNEAEFEKAMKENWKPVHMLRKQNKKITRWALYKVDFAGANDEYNYVTVHYYDAFEKTAPDENFPELIKAANPKGDATAIMAKARSLRTIVRQVIYSRVDFVTAKTPAPVKFVLINFMKTKEGMAEDYVNAETQDWKPVHQVLTDEGKRAGWNLWSMVLPGGSSSSHDYVAADLFSNYGQLADQGYADAFKKAHPGKEMSPMFQRVDKSRDFVRREVWELVESTD